MRFFKLLVLSALLAVPVKAASWSQLNALDEVAFQVALDIPNRCGIFIDWASVSGQALAEQIRDIALSAGHQAELGNLSDLPDPTQNGMVIYCHPNPQATLVTALELLGARLGTSVTWVFSLAGNDVAILLGPQK